MPSTGARCGSYRHTTMLWCPGWICGTAEDIAFKSKDGSEIHALLTKPLGYVSDGDTRRSFAFMGARRRRMLTTSPSSVRSLPPTATSSSTSTTAAARAAVRSSSEAIFADWGNLEVADVLAGCRSSRCGRYRRSRETGDWRLELRRPSDRLRDRQRPRFKAAISGAGSANHISLYGHDQYTFLYDNEFGPPWKNLDLWVKFSLSVLQADRITTPTLFMGGQDDFNVPILGSEQMYQALKTMNVPTQLVVYPGQNHGLTEMPFLRDRMEQYSPGTGSI